MSTSIFDRNRTVLLEQDRVLTHAIGKCVHYGPKHIQMVPNGVSGTIFLFTDEGDVRVQIEIDGDVLLADYQPFQLSKL